MDYQFKVALSFATEEQSLVEEVYHYLRAENINVFYAPSVEGQIILSGKNQREIFYKIFGLSSEYVALFVSKHYVIKKIPMEEARIAFAKHYEDSSVIPIYLDDTLLPADLFDSNASNYFKSNNPAVIANHLVSRIVSNDTELLTTSINKNVGEMVVKGNTAQKQIFVNTLNGRIIL